MSESDQCPVRAPGRVAIINSRYVNGRARRSLTR